MWFRMRENRSELVPLQHRMATVITLRRQGAEIGERFLSSVNVSSPADLLCSHVEQDVGRRQAKSHSVDQQGAGVRSQGDPLHKYVKHRRTVRTGAERRVSVHLLV